jgi:hypothetical protein
MLEQLIEIINSESGIDIRDNIRNTEYVELRSLYFVLAKEIYPAITIIKLAKSVNLTHASVIHSLNNFTIYSKYNKNLLLVKKKIITNYYYKDNDYNEIIISLKKEVDGLYLKVIELREKIELCGENVK